MGLHLHLTTTSDAAAGPTRTFQAVAHPGRRVFPFGFEPEAQLKLVATNNDPTIRFAYTPEPKDQGTKIVFIQVVRLSIDGVFVLPSGYQHKFAYKDPDTTSRKFVVDADSGEKDPYYNGDDHSNPDHGPDGGQQGNALVNPVVTANMGDTPNYRDSSLPAGKSKAKAEFRTAAFSAAGADAGTYYQYQDWTFEKETGKASKITVGTTGTDPGSDFKEAVDLWCKNQGFSLPKPAPKPAPPPPAPPKPGLKSSTYVVVPGDYLSKIAQAFYGNGNLWPKIYDANKDVIGPNPNLILPGQTLVIP